MPPKLKFTSPMYHPNGKILRRNATYRKTCCDPLEDQASPDTYVFLSFPQSPLVYPNGEVCISILVSGAFFYAFAYFSGTISKGKHSNWLLILQISSLEILAPTWRG